MLFSHRFSWILAVNLLFITVAYIWDSGPGLGVAILSALTVWQFYLAWRGTNVLKFRHYDVPVAGLSLLCGAVIVGTTAVGMFTADLSETTVASQFFDMLLFSFGVLLYAHGILNFGVKQIVTKHQSVSNETGELNIYSLIGIDKYGDVNMGTDAEVTFDNKAKDTVD